MRRFSPRWSRIDGSKPSKKQIQASREADWLEYLVEWKKFGGWVPALDPSSLNSSRWWVWGWLPIPHSSSVFCVLVLRAFRLKHLTPHRIISVCHCFGLLLRIGDISPWWWSICGCGCISCPRCYLDNLYDLIINIICSTMVTKWRLWKVIRGHVVDTRKCSEMYAYRECLLCQPSGWYLLNACWYSDNSHCWFMLPRTNCYLYEIGIYLISVEFVSILLHTV